MKFKELSTKAKIEYIWDYYKIHIIGILVVLFILVSAGSAIYTNKTRVIALDITYIGKSPDQAVVESIKSQVTEYMKAQDIKGELYFDVVNTIEPMSVMAVMNVKVSEDTLDIMIVDNTYFEEFAGQNLYAPLDELFQLGELSAEEEAYKTFRSESDTGEHIYGIDHKFAPTLLSLSYGVEGMHIGLYAESAHNELATQVMKMLLE